MIVYLFCFFLSSGVSLKFRNGGGCSTFNLAMGLKRWRLLLVIYLEGTSFIASPHEGQAHLSILTTPRSPPHVRSADDRF